MYGSLSLDIPGKPTLFIYRDITSYPGTYFNFSLSHSFDLYRGMTLDLMGAAGYFVGDSGYWKTYESSTGGYTGEKYQAFHDGLVSAGITIPVGKAFVDPARRPVLVSLVGPSEKDRGWEILQPERETG